MHEILMHDSRTATPAEPSTDRVIEILRQSLPRALAKADITSTTLLKDDLAVDSLGMMSFVLLLEDAFNIKLSPHVAAFSKVRSVGETAELMCRLLNPAATAGAAA